MSCVILATATGSFIRSLVIAEVYGRISDLWQSFDSHRGIHHSCQSATAVIMIQEIASFNSRAARNVFNGSVSFSFLFTFVHYLFCLSMALNTKRFSYIYFF